MNVIIYQAVHKLCISLCSGSKFSVCPENCGPEIKKKVLSPVVLSCGLTKGYFSNPYNLYYAREVFF